ncbi:MAG: DUF3516 domain-containing protein [Acidobacteriota bacterium]|jgi:hypothetical protein
MTDRNPNPGQATAAQATEGRDGVDPAAAGVVPLGERVPEGGTADPDEILDRFLEWAGDVGFELYPAQEEALLEVMAGRHVVLSTPTGSGKSLVALGVHFKGLCEGRRSFYTSPIKALASEKFFALCDELGPDRVGMLTGDASINPGATVICCTAEVLANMALRQGAELDAPYVVMDEFHYYSDRDRGVAWQIPLINLPETRFLLMSATLGDTRRIEEHLEERTGISAARVSSGERPVPLEFEYRETPIHETILDLVEHRQAPVYVVNFTQLDCADLAQSLTSMQVASREIRDRIKEELKGVRLDTPYGKEFRRFLGFGIGVHHGGLLPRYRLLVEQLSQKGLLQVISGTDTLGVGVNIPIRTVLFSKLAKFDGRKVRILSVRDFQQISGRAGRKGFDDRGWVVAQAPEHVIEKRQIEMKAASKAQARKQLKKRSGQQKGEVSWTEETFEALRTKPPETLRSRFRIGHGTVLALLQRDAELDDPGGRNFDSLRELIRRSHEDPAAQRRHLTHAAVLVRSLYRAGVIHMVEDVEGGYRWVVPAEDLQWDFSLLQVLALYVVQTVERLDPESPDYPLDVLSLVEAILEDPRIVLLRQEKKRKGDLIARLKADGVPYEERMERLEEVTYPRPLADFLHGAFQAFKDEHPWVGGRDVSPKGVGREMFSEYLSFADFVRRYGLQRSEGVLLRYLSQLYKTVVQTVPEVAKTEAVWDAIGYFRTLLERTDTSLLEEWESLLHPEIRLEREGAHAATEAKWLLELAENPKVLAARVRTEMHLLVRALSEGDWEEAAESVRQDPDDPWDAERFEEAMAPFLEEYGELVFTPEARRHRWTHIQRTGPLTRELTQTLLDPEGDHLWAIHGEVDLHGLQEVEGPLVRVLRIGP